MKQLWVTGIVLLAVLFFSQQFQSYWVYSYSKPHSILLARQRYSMENGPYCSGSCTGNDISTGAEKLANDNPDRYTNFKDCIYYDSNYNWSSWCCVCYQDSPPDVCGTSSLSCPLTPVPTETPIPTNTPTPIPTRTPTPTPVVIDCIMTDWSSCSKTCGGGIKTRQVITYPNQWGQACGPISDSCNNQLCSDYGTGGLINTNSTGQVIILSNLDPVPTPQRLPTPTPEPVHFNVIDYYLQAFQQPTPTRVPTPTTIPIPTPTISSSNQLPTETPTMVQLIPTPTLRPESIIPESLAAQTHTVGRTSFTLNTATLSEINIVPNNENTLLSQEQQLLAQNAGMAAGGIIVTLQQKTGSPFVTRQDELTVKRGNQFFSISNQNEIPNAQTSQTSQKTTSNATDSSPAPGAKLEINANNVVAQSSMALSVDPLSGILIVETPNGPQKVSIMPDEALGIVIELKALKAKENGVQSILLVSEKGKLIYRISGEKMEKFLGFFPLSVQKQVLVSADTGSVVKVELPLFSQILSFFTF